MDINASLIGQMITFIILVVFTMKFVWPPLNKMLEQRANKIASGLAAAEKAQQDLLDVESRVAQELKKVHKKADDIIAHATTHAKQIIDEAAKNATLEAARIVSSGKEQLEREITMAKETLKGEVARLVLLSTQEILQDEIDPKRHEDIIKNALATF